MSDPTRLMVQAIDPWAWEAGEVDPRDGIAMTVAEWLEAVRACRIALRAQPASGIAGGPYAGGHVLVGHDGGGRLYFAVPAPALPLLADVLPADDYADLLRRTPALGQPGERAEDVVK